MSSRNPPSGRAPGDGQLRSQRRQSGGPRRESSERVVVRAAGGFESEGWTLNMSRGGVRVVLEDAVSLGATVSLVFSASEGRPMVRPGSVVWVQDEPDGQIAGIKFLDGSGSEPPGPPD